MKTCMRYLAVIFAVAMIICALSSVSAAFPDVASDNKYKSAIDTMTNLGIIGGYEDGTFRPDDLVRRDEMAKIIYVTFTTYTDAGEGTVTFPDVAKNSWAKGYISWCAGKAIVGGYEDGTFRPAGNITYDEALKMVCAMLGYTDFDSELWPVDVRTKGLIDLELGDNLDGIAGDAALTRAQVVQLVSNALDKPMYQAPKEDGQKNPFDFIFGGAGVVTTTDKATLKDNVWGVETVTAQVIGTENYGLRDYMNGIVGTKTEEEDEIVVRFNYDDGTAENKTVNLKDVGLDSYIGNNDGLIALNINLITKKGEEGYLSAQLVGTRKEDLTGGYASTDGVPTFKSGSSTFAQYGIKVEGVNYYDDRFLNLKRITYFDDIVLVTHGQIATNSTKVSNKFQLDYSWNYNYFRWNCCFLFGLTQGFDKVQKGIDADGDGWYDYILIEYAELFKVKSVTAKTVELEYLHKGSLSSWKAVPDIDLSAYTDIDGSPLYSGYEETTEAGVIKGLDFVFPIENVTVIGKLQEGAVIQGYQIGDTFTVTADAVPYTGYITKYDAAGKKYTIDNGKTLGGDYCSWNVWNSHNVAGNMFSNFNSSMKPLIGINDAGEFNYAKFWTIEDKIIWAEKVEADAASTATASYNKAILLYVTEATEPQVNEETKEYDVFYPAYLVIDGRTQLVNLNPTYAINKFSGESVAADGSKFRASVINDDGKQRIMYANLLVTYTVDSEGFYTLYTENESLVDPETKETIELVIPAAEGLTLSVNSQTGLYTVYLNGRPVQGKIVTNKDSIVYYPTFNEATGKHEYIESYIGDEIPKEFAEAAIRSNVYLTYNKEKDVHYISALVLAADFESATVDPDKANYENDARLHVYAIRGAEAVVEGKDIFAAYTFKSLNTLETIDEVNSKIKYNDATKTEMNKIYGWDATTKNYVEVTNTLESYFGGEIITDYLVEEDILFTTTFNEGIKIDDTVKLIAVTDKETAEIKAITVDELVEILELVEDYNEENSASETVTAKIGTYKDDKNLVCAAYVIIDWVEYDEELEALVIAGEAK